MYKLRPGLILFCLILLIMSKPGFTQPAELATNFTQVHERLHTSGQPSEEMLAGLSSRGYGLVVNLATPASADAIPTEGKLVTANGITYVNIPVDWQKPTYADFELFSAILKNAGDRRVLVHCQVNMRASMFTFLYQVVHEREDPAQAFQYVSPIWHPRDQWLAFGNMVLVKHNISFTFPD